MLVDLVAECLFQTQNFIQRTQLAAQSLGLRLRTRLRRGECTRPMEKNEKGRPVLTGNYAGNALAGLFLPHQHIRMT